MSIKICYFHIVFSENAKELSNKYNWPIENEFNPKNNDIYILFGSNEIPQILLKHQEESPFKIFYIILNSEQIESRFLRDPNYIKLLKNNFVLSYSSDITRWLEKNLNIKVLGSFYFSFPELNLTCYENREIDVVFVGTVTPRRRDIIENLQKTSLNIYADFEWKYKIPEDLTKLLNNSKVVINVPYYNKNSLETHRIIKALSCGCTVISLRSSDDDLDSMFEDYIYFTNNILKSVSKYFNKELKPKKTFKELIEFLDSKIDYQFKTSIDTVIKLRE